ncbi:MAG: hypothetical protein LBH53_03325 [Puniceicoccales bacterium]|jgi:hypothetical protein|nr:hypothetical protein [Puniceicoccales bacterium]
MDIGLFAKIFLPGLLSHRASLCVGRKITHEELADLVRTAPADQITHGLAILDILERGPSRKEKGLFIFICCFTFFVIPLVYYLVLRNRFSRKDGPMAQLAEEVAHAVRGSSHSQSRPIVVPKTNQSGDAVIFVQRMKCAATKEGGVTPASILAYVQTETAEMDQESRRDLLKKAVMILRRSEDSYRSVAMPTILAFLGGHIYEKTKAKHTHKSNACAYEMADPDDSRRVRMVKVPREHSSAPSQESMAQNMAVSAMGEYFSACGAPAAYVKVAPAILDGELAVSMQAATGVQLSEGIGGRKKKISKDDFVARIEAACSAARVGKSYLAVTSAFVPGKNVVVPKTPIVPSWLQELPSPSVLPKKLAKKAAKMRCEEIRKKLFADSPTTLIGNPEQGLHFAPLSEVATRTDIGIVGGSDLFIKQTVDQLTSFFGEKPKNEPVAFLFRPFLGDNGSLVCAVTCKYDKEEKKYEYAQWQIPKFPQERSGKELRSATWLALMDGIVGYWDRRTLSNTFVDGNGNMQSIDFDGCFDSSQSPTKEIWSFPAVIDREMAQWIDKLDISNIRAIMEENGLSEKQIAAALDRLGQLRAHTKEKAQIIAVDEWKNQGVDVYLSTFWGHPPPRDRIVSILSMLSADRDVLLAPNSDPKTEADDYAEAVLRAWQKFP